MSISNFLHVDGTSLFQVLCYGLFPGPPERPGLAKRDGGFLEFVLFEESWPCHLVLQEYTDDDIDIALNRIWLSIRSMIDKSECLVSVCMLDGAFEDYRSVLDSKLSSQIYAIAFSHQEFVVNTDVSVLNSDAWRRIVSASCSKLGDEYCAKVSS